MEAESSTLCKSVGSDEGHLGGRVLQTRVDDSRDDNDDNQRHTVPATGHRRPTVTEHRACAAVGYGSEGRDR
jgi:hypothetical protein